MREQLRVAVVQRWPLLLATCGLFLLVYGSLDGGGPPFADPIFWMLASTVVAGLSAYNWLYATSHSRSLAVSSLVLYGIVRSIDYLSNGATNPLGVWMIVAGLALQLSRNARVTRQLLGDT